MSKLIRLGWSQLKTYLTTVLTDYKAVAKDVIVELEEKPWKFVLGGISLCFFYTAYACNPTYQDFLSTVTQCRLQLLQLADLMRNERSQAHVDKLSILFNQQAIHAVNCIFFTVLLEKESLDGCDLYSVQNSLDKWTKWQDRIVDIGAFDRWFLLSKSMQNYDVRE
ncbi:Mitochondrial import inner membrane translocase subunit [Trichinella spiralis]|uniref:Mitochondrial import inner membrane translocase subunit n=1 Tax=Trichinella spiralis TaxID=6334 RepID=A0ABR3KXF3_TRISP|nr:collagen alpha-2(IV) chain [Trichinella spiralis]